MTIWQKFLRALRSFPWWARRRSVACDPARSFSNEELAEALGLRRVVLVDEPITDPSLEIPSFDKAQRLAQIARERDVVKDKIERAKKQKTRRVHLYAALSALTEEEMRIEAGK